MRRHRATLATLAALLALTSAAPLGTAGAAEPSAGATRAAASTLQWTTCQSARLRAAGAECATLAVPLDYARPGGRQITLALSRVQHTSSAADYRGPILVNFGGPGAPGLDASTLGSDVPNGVGDSYDWIGFDPRGVGASRPALRCIPGYFHADRPDYRPRNQHLVQVWLNRSRHYADACARKHPALIEHLTTLDSARDMDRIRQALGVDAISYYGFSYGTYLGQVFATRFPQRLTRAVFDSTVDPTRVWYAANLDQDLAFDRNIRIWFRWVARYHSTYHLGSTEQQVQKKWYAVLDQLAAHPAGGKLGPDEWTDSFLYAGYYRFVWTQLGRLFADYVHQGSWRPLLRFYRDFNGSSDDNGYAVYLGVQCTDAHWPQRWSQWERDNTRVAAKAPFETWSNAWFNAPCLFWHARAHKPVRIDGSKAGSVLLIDETLDAATPYHGSLVARRLFPHSSLIAEPGGATHADSLSGDACVDNLVARYLKTGKRPPRQQWNGADYLCRPLPDPAPAGHRQAPANQPSGASVTPRSPAWLRARATR